jgi:hypothetical protein
MFHLYNGPYRCTTTQQSLLSMFCYGFVLFLYCQLRESESVMGHYQIVVIKFVLKQQSNTHEYLQYLLCRPSSDIHFLGNDKVMSMEYKITSDIN